MNSQVSNDPTASSAKRHVTITVQDESEVLSYAVLLDDRQRVFMIEPADLERA